MPNASGVDWQQETAKVLIELTREKALREAAERERDAWKTQSETWRNLFLESNELVKKSFLLDAGREKEIENLNAQIKMLEKKSFEDSQTIQTLSEKVKKGGTGKLKAFGIGFAVGFGVRTLL